MIEGHLTRAAALLAALAFFRPASAEDLTAAARRAAADLAAALAASPERAAVRQVAAPPFAEAGAARGLGTAAVEALSARFAEIAGVEILDRAKLEAVLGEQRLKVMMGTGRVDDPEAAKRIGTQATLLGQLTDDGDRLRLTVRLVSASTGKTIAQAGVPADLPARPSRANVESGDIEVAIRRLADGLAMGFARMPGSSKYRRLAVLTFQENGEQAARRKLGTIVTAEVATRLQRDHGLLVVERARLGEVLGELKLRQMLSLDPSQAGEIGRMADAQALVIGSVSDAGDRFLVNARIVATQTGETLAAESVSPPAAGMVALESDAVVLRSRSGAVFRSLLVPGFGQFYNRQPAKAWAFIGAEAALLGSALGFHLSARSAYDEYLALAPPVPGSPSEEATRLYDLAESRTRTRDWLLVGAAAVWAVNVVDAYLSGVDGESLLGGSASAPRAFQPTVALRPGGAVAGALLRF
ncbi:MAG TPA: FlgO family outer membrane protein [Anaeromyxobacteraceae bacterium]|nr:FlgO family outer membrane protein [Anaeromyxobacteraceae bacterium]